MVRVVVNRSEFEIATARAGLTISQLSEKIGVTKQNVYSALNGRSGLSPGVAKKASDILKEPFDKLFTIINN